MKIVIKNLVACAFVCGLLFVGGAGASAYGGLGADSMDGCTGCHATPGEEGDNIGNSVPNTPAAKPPGHEAYTAEQCIGCHADQGGTNHAANDNCAGCHTEQAIGEAPPPPTEKPYGHENYTNDDCAGCHTGYDTNHYGSNCLGCHTETSTTPPPSPAKPYGHENYTNDDCAGCHTGYNTNHYGSNCLGCHTETTTTPPSAPPNHYTDTHMGGFENNVGADNAEGGSCDSCHEVHMSEDSNYLTKDVNGNNKSEGSETCLPCHSNMIGSNSSHTTNADCAKCHNIHGPNGDEEDAGPDAGCISSPDCHAGYDTNHFGPNCTECHK